MSASRKPPSAIRPIGVLGGSFDPIHVGHLQLARDARDRLGLAQVRLIPAAQPWQKGPITAGAHRARMVQLAITGEPGLALDRQELDRGGASYTIDTLRALRAALGPEQPLVLVIGADQMERLDTWREWQSLLDHAHLAVASRNSQPPALSPTLRALVDAHHAAPAALRTRPHGAIVDLPMTPVDASATEVRALLAAPASPARDARLAALVPAPVLLYIRHQGLYAPPAQLAVREKVKAQSMDLQKLQRVVVDALEDVKAQDISVFNTVGLSDLFDRVILASGSSTRQSRALAWSVVEKVKEAGGQVVSVEGTDPGEWVLVDLGDIVVHVMQPAIRQYYGLEELWGAKPVKVKLAAERRGNRPDRDQPPAPAGLTEAISPPSAARSPAARSATTAAATKPASTKAVATKAVATKAVAARQAAGKKVVAGKSAKPKARTTAKTASRRTATSAPSSASKASVKRAAESGAKAGRKVSTKSVAAKRAVTAKKSVAAKKPGVKKPAAKAPAMKRSAAKTPAKRRPGGR